MRREWKTLVLGILGLAIITASSTAFAQPSSARSWRSLTTLAQNRRFPAQDADCQYRVAVTDRRNPRGKKLFLPVQVYYSADTILEIDVPESVGQASESLTFFRQLAIDEIKSRLGDKGTPRVLRYTIQADISSDNDGFFRFSPYYGGFKLGMIVKPSGRTTPISEFNWDGGICRSGPDFTNICRQFQFSDMTLQVSCPSSSESSHIR
jgi:hypothetical protein